MQISRLPTFANLYIHKDRRKWITRYLQYLTIKTTQVLALEEAKILSCISYKGILYCTTSRKNWIFKTFNSSVQL